MRPKDGRVEGRRIHLDPEYSISRIIVGGWQFSAGHGAEGAVGLDPEALLDGLVELGLTTFDCADIYTGVEELFGRFLRRRRSGEPGEIQIHTKFVPDLDVLPRIRRSHVERIINRSLSRLGVEALDLVQFHWWDFTVPGYVEVMHWLGALKEEGKIRHLGVTNFDQLHLAELVDSGAEIVSNQVQYSVLDRRPEKELAPYCREKGISLLCYGALAGGFLTDRYLGMEEPPGEMENRSLVKYRLIIEEMGGWKPYLALLGTLGGIARRRGVPLPSVALRYVLDGPGVAAAITGLASPAQAVEALKALDLRLEAEDVEALEEALRNVRPPPGPVYGLERDREGPHGVIMRYNLNEE
jgi:aryl-alcohol dehydrogenase-like predicted oxidoreductase